MELEEDTETRGRTRSEERIIPQLINHFIFFFPPDDNSHSSAILLLLGCQIPESHLERHIITTVTVMICDISLYLVNVWIPTSLTSWSSRNASDWVHDSFYLSHAAPVGIKSLFCWHEKVSQIMIIRSKQ